MMTSRHLLATDAKIRLTRAGLTVTRTGNYLHYAPGGFILITSGTVDADIVDRILQDLGFSPWGYKR